MAETYYVDVVETANVNCVLDGMAELVSVDSNAACLSINSGSGTLTFTIESDGAYRITSTGTTPFLNFAIGNKVIVRGSVDTTGLINNDGVYTVEEVDGSDMWIEVVEPVKACASVAVAYVDEFATFILHPTKRTGQMLIFLSSAAALAELNVSFEPGGYWASKIEIGQPVYQGTGVASKMYLLQIETAPYMKTIEKKVAIDATESHDVETKGTILMRVFPGVGDPLLVSEIEVAYIMIA